MDVSGWTIDQKMRLPDWCFGNRRLISVSKTSVGVGVVTWQISGVTLPREICIWTVGFLIRSNDSYISYLRLGFRATVPTSIAEMDTSIPVLPDLGNIAFTPPRINLADEGREVWQFELRKGMDTGALKLTIELKCGATEVALIVFMTYSELPTSMAGWLAHNKV